MASYEQDGKPLPKFGEWDVNDPASAEGFTVIFNKARDEKKKLAEEDQGALNHSEEIIRAKLMINPARKSGFALFRPLDRDIRMCFLRCLECMP